MWRKGSMCIFYLTIHFNFLFLLAICFAYTMVFIDDFNDQTLWRIFRYSIGDIRPVKYSWRHQLRLLAVCRRWRSMILGFLFQFAYLDYRDYGDGEVTINTNIELVTSNCWYNPVGKLILEINTHSDAYEVWSWIFNCFIFNHLEWLLLRDVDIIFIDGIFASHNISKFRHLANEFARHAPNVVCLDVANSEHDCITEFTSSLVNTYGNRLQRLTCPHINIDRSIIFSDQLTCLSISFNEQNICYFPTVLCKSLQVLRLRGLPLNFSMAHFADTNNPRDILFTSLVELELVYQATMIAGNSAGSYFRRPYHSNMHAPKLKYIYLFNPSPDCDIIYSLHGLHLDRLIINSGVHFVDFLSTQSIRVANRLNISVTIADMSGTDSNIVNSTNHFFSQNIFGSDISFNLSGLECDLDFQTAHWEYLCELRIELHIKISALLNIMQSLLNVENIFVGCLLTELACDKADDNAAVLSQMCMQLCPNIKRVFVGRKAVYNSATHAEMVGLITYLLVAMHSPVIFGMLEEFREDVESFVATNRASYPHLDNVEIYNQ